MGILKSILREVVELRKEVRNLQALQDPMILEKARRYDEISKHLKNVRLTLENIYPKTSESGDSCVIINYSPRKEIVYFDEHGEPVVPQFVVSANWLNLLSVDEMGRIHTAIEMAKTENK